MGIIDCGCGWCGGFGIGERGCYCVYYGEWEIFGVRVFEFYIVVNDVSVIFLVFFRVCGLELVNI